VDGDVFSRVSKQGRAAADAVLRTIRGEPWDPFHATRCIERLINGAKGIPSLRVVAAELAGLRQAPLLAPVAVDDALARIRSATLAEPGCTELDLVLRSNVERSVLRGDHQLRPILESFCGQLLERAVLTGRNGFMERNGLGLLARAHAVLAPVATAAAAALDARPSARRLRLSQRYANVTPTTNLLGEP
jgi:hypothetical protein